jgi:hypothetical protein
MFAGTLRRYEDYLDSQITGTDIFYLEDIELARQLVELGCVTANAHAYMSVSQRQSDNGRRVLAALDVSGPVSNGVIGRPCEACLQSTGTASSASSATTYHLEVDL